jgi:hypothetical protein
METIPEYDIGTVTVLCFTIVTLVVVAGFSVPGVVAVSVVRVQI